MKAQDLEITLLYYYENCEVAYSVPDNCSGADNVVNIDNFISMHLTFSEGH